MVAGAGYGPAMVRAPDGGEVGGGQSENDAGVLAVLDDDGEEVVLDAVEADALFALTDGLEAATVSACPDCRSRVLACVALVDLLDAAPPHPLASELIELADDAPTLHLYVQDLAATVPPPPLARPRSRRMGRGPRRDRGSGDARAEPGPARAVVSGRCACA